MKRLTILVVVIAFASYANAAYSQQSYADYVGDIEAQWLAYSEQQQLEEFQREQDAALQAFRKQQSVAYREYREGIEAKWDEFLEPTPEQWVDYNDVGDTRVIVNFEEKVEEGDAHGQLTVEVLVDASLLQRPEVPEGSDSPDVENAPDGLDPADGVVEPGEPAGAPPEAVQHIAAQIESLVSQVQGESGAPPLLEDQLQTSDGKVVNAENVQEYIAEEILQTIQIDPEPFQSADGVQRVRISVVVPLVPNHLRVRAEKYLPIVKKHGAEHAAPVPLTMSIIQTESYFNRRAKSHVPAYGLMQLVPNSGGRDAYREVFKEDKAPSAEFLYVPDNNVRLGTAYYHVIRDRYLYGVEDPRKAELLAIAAYNGGIGRVIKRVMKRHEIPEMTVEELYDALREAMPEETADYLEKVTSRKDNYTEWEE
jgi:membrane-bound lytic murein transglycosylase C